MIGDRLKNIGPLPNEFSRTMGRLIQRARMDANMSQRQLAAAIERRRPSLSDMENGKMLPDPITLMLIAYTLDRSIGYFFPPPWQYELKQEDLSIEEQDLLLQFRSIKDVEIRKIAVNQIRSLAHYDIHEERESDLRIDDTREEVEKLMEKWEKEEKKRDSE